jgi:allantoin racemase
MRLLIVNPNTTASMTGKIAAAARAVAREGTEIVATQPADGPASIEGFYDGALAAPGVLREIAAHPEADAVIIACFDDTGLDAARCVTEAPVVGIGEAAFHMASILSNKFSAITTLSCSVPVIEANLARYGLNARCVRVRATEIPVLDLENEDLSTIDRISAEIEAAIKEDGAEAIVLGCAGMSNLMDRLSAEHGVPVLDGVACATTLAEAIVSCGLKASKSGGYAPPRLKKT